jgi:hypothetical protein
MKILKKLFVNNEINKQKILINFASNLYTQSNFKQIPQDCLNIKENS